jgi:hypothetical protein
MWGWIDRETIFIRRISLAAESKPTIEILKYANVETKMTIKSDLGSGMDFAPFWTIRFGGRQKINFRRPRNIHSWLGWRIGLV